MKNMKFKKVLMIERELKMLNILGMGHLNMQKEESNVNIIPSFLTLHQSEQGRFIYVDMEGCDVPKL